jgi:hypothetical protein
MEPESPLIVGFIADLFFAVKVEDAARRLNYRVEWIERAGQVAPPDPDAPSRQLAEHLVGPGAVLLDKLTLWKPALLIFDLGIGIPWRQWMPLIRPPRPRRIRFCASAHVDVDAMSAGRGADAVLARSQFSANLLG